MPYYYYYYYYYYYSNIRIVTNYLLSSKANNTYIVGIVNTMSENHFAV